MPEQAQKDKWFHAATTGDASSIARLPAEGIRPDTTTSEGYTALMFATWGGYTAVVEQLISSGCDIDKTTQKGGQFALQWAAERGHIDCARHS